MNISKTLTLIIGASYLMLGNTHGQDESLSVGEGKQIIKKWIETQKLISQEKADWTEDRVVLQESVRVFKQESEKISKEIDEAKESTDKTQTEYDKLFAENEDIIQANEKVAELVKIYEIQTSKLIPKLPSYLQEKIEPLTNRLPKDSNKSKAPITNRMQVVVAVISEIEKFQNSINLVNELRKVNSGEEIEVKTLYLGLGQAFYADQSGQFAGVGIPGESGWEWKDQPGLGQSVLRAIDQYEEKIAASFTSLPVVISK